MEVKDINLTQEQLKKTLNVSLKVLETAGDPIVVGEAKKIEGVVDQLIAVSNKEHSTVLDHIESAKSFDKSLVTKYGLTAARIIEFGMVALIAIKYLYLG